jgi:hypothetical protein
MPDQAIRRVPMPRNYNTFANSGGTNMVGRAYTPQVTPWDRYDDDVSVQHSLRDDNQEWRDDRDGRPLDRDYDYRSRDRYNREQDAYYRRDLTPGYGDDRRGYQNAGNSEPDDRHRAGHRKHWENREPDYRYQYNDYRRADDNDARRENMARHRDGYYGYQRESDRDGWMNDRDYRAYNRDWREDSYNDRERYYAREDDERDRGRWNRR